MSENPYLRNLVPHSARRHDFLPTVDSYITLALPHELIRAKVKGVSESANAVIAEIDSVPMGKTHSYKKGDIVPCRRVVDNVLQAEQWTPIPERELDLAAAQERLKQEEAREKIATAEHIVIPTDDPAAPPELKDVMDRGLEESFRQTKEALLKKNVSQRTLDKKTDLDSWTYEA